MSRDTDFDVVTGTTAPTPPKIKPAALPGPSVPSANGPHSAGGPDVAQKDRAGDDRKENAGVEFGAR